MSMTNVKPIVKLNRDKEVKFSAPSNRRTGVCAKSNAPALMTLTYHDRCGRRLSFGRVVFENLGSPKDITVAFNENYMVVRNGKGRGLALSKVDTGKPILYVAALAGYIVENYNIDLSEHTTVSFYNGFYEEDAYYIELAEAPTSVSDKSDEGAEEPELLEDELELEEE